MASAGRSNCGRCISDAYDRHDAAARSDRLHVWKKQPRKALWFMLGMFPAVLGWMLWVRTHAAPGRDIVTVAYTNYIDVFRVNVGWDNLGVIVWHNVTHCSSRSDP